MQGAQALALLLQLGMVVTAAISFYFTGTGAALMLRIAVQAHDMAELVCCGALHWTC